MTKKETGSRKPSGAPDKQQRKINRRGYLLIILAFALVLGLMLLGFAVGNKPWFIAHRAIFLAVFIVLCAIPAAVGVWSVVSYRSLVKRLNSMRTAEMRDFILNERKNALDKMEESKAEMKRLRKRAFALAAFLFFVAAGIAFLGGALLHGELLLIVFCLYSLALFASVLIRIPMEMPLDFIEDDKTFVLKKDFPALYSIAEETAGKMGMNNELHIALYPDGNMAVVKIKDAVMLRLGVYSLIQMNEGELKSILCHEFAHIKNEEKNDPEKRYLSRYASYVDSILTAPSSMLFAKVDADYDLRCQTYRFASSVIFEEEADKAMTLISDKKTAASALIKVAYTDYYLYEVAFSRDGNYYTGQEPSSEEVACEAERFMKAVAERKEYWNSLIPKEILSRTASHPTLAMRLKALGVDEIKTEDTPAGRELAEDIEKAIKYLNGLVHELRLENYEELHRMYYEKPLELVENWKREGGRLTPEGYREIVEAMTGLGMIDEAEALCEEAMTELPDEAQGYACFTKGRMLLHRYNDEGIDLLYRAMEHNQNYIEQALDEIGSYCCHVGNEKELARYRERSMELLQKHADEYGMIEDLKRGDDLKAEHLPDGALERDVKFITEAGEDLIDKLYLVRKTVPNGFFTSAYVVRFKKGTEWDKQNDIMEKIFNYLDTVSDWQYSLFTWDEVSSAGIDKIEGTLVYEKTDR